MIDYNVEKEKQFLDDIHKLTIQIKSDIENNHLSETEIHNKINFYEKKYEYYKVFLQDPVISSPLILFRGEILKLKDRLKKS